MKKSTILLLAITIFLLSCGENNSTNPILRPEIMNALERITVANNTLELWTVLQRDFMPICPPGGQPMRAHIRLYDISSHPIPNYIKPESLWVVNDGEVWADDLNQFFRSPANDTIYCGNRNGPKWDPGLEVDLIIKFLFVNKPYYLKAQNQIIFRTD